jgi:hypothetical protein
MSRKSIALGSLLGSAALAAAALTSTASAAADPVPAAPASTPSTVAAAPLPAPVVKWSKQNGHKVATFDLVRSTAVVAKGCLPYAKAKVSIEQTEEVEIMRVYASGLPKKTEFDFFVLQQPDTPFGMSWYQGDLESDKYGRAYVKFIGRFNEETFTVAPGALPAPVTHDEQPFPDADKNPATPPVHQYHLGFWFNSPKDASAAGCGDAVTPFNGEHNAGLQAMSTRQFPVLAGPLSRIQP